MNLRVKALRKQLKMTQRAFGQLLGLSHQVISDIERGVAKPSKTTLEFLKFRFGETFGIPENESSIPKARLSYPVVKRVVCSGAQKQPSHEEVIQWFHDRDWAIEMNMMLVELEQTDPSKKEVLAAYVRGVLDTVRQDKKKGNQS